MEKLSQGTIGARRLLQGVSLIGFLVANAPRVESALTVGEERLVRAALEAGARPATIGRELGIGRTSVARFAGTLEAERSARS